MNHDFLHTRNLAGLPEGSFRSIAGYAGESLAIGRALFCGYNLSFKAWRDAKYDAVLDHRGHLYRIEIKQSAGPLPELEFSVTSGGRSGAQISREAESRSRVLSEDDCDFLLAIHTPTASAWVVPVGFVHALGRPTLGHKLLEDFHEAWHLFETIQTPLSGVPVNRGLTSLDDAQIATLCAHFQIVDSTSPQVVFATAPRSRVIVENLRHRNEVAIWRALAKVPKAPLSAGGNSA